ncbi:cysteine desulfurase family protein [Hydrotalea sp.]|uniref:cysteine desulfurase family protein n=1 Tax=Hydrotalea sp. TaxID=2881279 RepID=UPI003D0A6798
MMQLPIYFDYNATTPVDPRVLEAMLPFYTVHFGNAASKNHVFGWQADEAVNIAREQIAALIHANANEIIFTSGATESVNLALKGIAESYALKGNHIVTLITEHKAVLDTCKHLEQKGVAVTYLPVQSNGLVNLSDLESAIQPNTILIAVMYANNEIGVIQNIAAISAIAKRHNVLFFSDATQAVGKIPVNVLQDGIDVMAFSAHKMYGPKGVGALYVRRKNPKVKLMSQIDGGGHEKGMRSGTLNVPGIVGFGKAAEICQQQREQDATNTAYLRNKLEAALLQLKGTIINGSVEHRLPHVSNVSFQNRDGDALLRAFNKHIAVSSGSACTSATLQPSHVLKAIGMPDDLALSSVRFSLGRFSTETEVNAAIQLIEKTLQQLPTI